MKKDQILWCKSRETRLAVMGSYNVRKEQKVADKEKPIVRLGCYDEKQ